jgi:hydrogenase-4 component B
MLVLLLLLLASYAVGIALGISGLVASEPMTSSVGSAIPFLTFAVRLDPLASLFVLTISLAGLAASIYTMGYLKVCDLRLRVWRSQCLLSSFPNNNA